MATKRSSVPVPVPVPVHNKKPVTGQRMDMDLFSCFQRNGVLYIPHYRETTFVGPGYGFHNFKEYTTVELVMAGAQRILQPLWMRSAHKNT